MLTTRYDLDVQPGGELLYVHTSQYDVGARQFIFHLINTNPDATFELPAGVQAEIRGTKPDGNGFSYEAVVDDYDVTVDITAQMTPIAGNVRCELILYTGDPDDPDETDYTQLGTANFIMVVERAALDKDTLRSNSEIRQLVNVIDNSADIIAAGEQVQGVVAQAQEYAQDALDAANAAHDSAIEAEDIINNATSAIEREYQADIQSLKDALSDGMNEALVQLAGWKDKAASDMEQAYESDMDGIAEKYAEVIAVKTEADNTAAQALRIAEAAATGSMEPEVVEEVLGLLNDIDDHVDSLDATVDALDEATVRGDKIQSFTEAQKYNARISIDALGVNDYGVPRFGVSGVGQSSPTLTRLYNAVGMTATPATDAVDGHSDFDAYAPFNRRKCVGSWSVKSGESKATFTVNAYQGDADYAEDGSMGDYVAVEVEPFYYYDQDGILAVSTHQYPGYKIHPVCVDYDGNIRAKTYLPVYALALDGNSKAVSLPGYQNECGAYKTLRDDAKTYNNADAKAYAIIEPSAAWHYEWLLQTIEFATTDMQSVMRGAADMRYNTADVISAVPGANKIVLGSTGSNFVVGQTILINASHDATVAVSNFNCITALEKCSADGTPSESGTYWLITYDGTDRSSSITAGTTKIGSRPWITGATDGYAPGVNAVRGHTGSPVSNSSSKYPMRYRWRENVYGNQNMTSLDLADVRISDGDDTYHLEWYYLADPRLYSPYGNFSKTDLQDATKGWVKLGVSTPVASYVNGYVKELGFDSAYPWVKVPILTTGGSASTYFSDYAYLVLSHEVRCVRRGGYVLNGAYAGPCFFYASLAPSNASWSYGATLYFLQ